MSYLEVTKFSYIVDKNRKAGVLILTILHVSYWPSFDLSEFQYPHQ